MRPTPPDATTSPEPVEHFRTAVVDRVEQRIGLTANGIDALTHADVLGFPDYVIRKRFASGHAELYVSAATEDIADAAQDRLQRLRVRVSWHRVIDCKVRR